MPKHRTASDTAVILALKKAGLSHNAITAQTGWSNRTIKKVVADAKKLPAGTIPGRKPGTGLNNRKATPALKAILARAININPKATAKSIRASNPRLFGLTVRTIQRVLHVEMGLSSRRCAKKPFLNIRMKEKRLAFARAHQHWTVDDWKMVMFSDESHFFLWKGNRFQRCRRPRGSDRFADRYTQKTVKFPPKIMFWACFSYKGRGGIYPLPPRTMMNAPMYQKILKEHLLPFMRRHQMTMFLQDGAPPHRAKSTTAFLANCRFDIIKWPGNSPDLNPIENCWSWMKMQLKEIHTANLTDLLQEVKLLWVTATPVEYLRTLIDSMPRRMEAVIAKNGGMTKY
jgi:transposase